MIDINEQLDIHGDRLRRSSTDVVIPEFQPSHGHRPPARVAAVITLVAATVAVGYVARTAPVSPSHTEATSSGQQPANRPTPVLAATTTVPSTPEASTMFTTGTPPPDVPEIPGFTGGAYGTQIVLMEIDDGDDNPETVLVRTEPGGYEFRIEPAPPQESTPVDGEPSVMLNPCWTYTFPGGTTSTACEPYLASSGSFNGPDGGQAFRHGLADNVAAVVFTHGADQYWQRPVRGHVYFPLPADATGPVTMTTYDITGQPIIGGTKTVPANPGEGLEPSGGSEGAA